MSNGSEHIAERSAVVTIQKAIQRLEELRIASDEGDDKWAWELSPIENTGYLRQADVVDEPGNVIVERAFEPDADLIVSLHRAIDPMLTILREAETWGISDGTIDLARAILGEDQ